MKLVKESLNEFHQTGDPLKSLNIGKHGIDNHMFSAYETLIKNGIKVKFPKVDSDTLHLVNRHGIEMALVKKLPFIWDIYVEYNDDDIPLTDLSFQDALDNILNIDNDWIRESSEGYD